MSPLQVLVIASDSERVRILAAPLRAAGHLVAAESDRATAGDDLQGPGFDAAIVDLQLPGLDRAALARALVPPGTALPPEPLDAVERRHILATLEFTGGNKRRAALLLGIARSTLIQKVRRYRPEAE